MKRWKVVEDDYTMLLYYSDYETALSKNPSAIITEYIEDYHSEYCEKIMELSEEQFFDYKGRIVYVINTYYGKLYVRLYKDNSDNKWYDYCEYQLHKNNSLIKPILYTMSNPKDVYFKYVEANIKYEILSFRKYGEPKLEKPKELKGIKVVGSVEFIKDKCNPQYFIKDNDVYVKHTDYFSPMYCRPEDIGMPLSYRCEKYGIKPKKEKFVYNDNWGAIVLRQEAWIKISGLLFLLEELNYSEAAKEIVKEMAKCHKCRAEDIDLEWERFFEKLCKEIKHVEEKKN